MFNPVIIIAIIIQFIIARFSRKAGAVVGYLITTGILIWGLVVYGDGDQIALFGIPLSEPIFIVACLFWYAMDTRDLITANKAPTAIIQPAVQPAITSNSVKQIPDKVSNEPIKNPCKVVFYRDYAMSGGGSPLIIYLNGAIVGEVSNGKSIEFSTKVGLNLIIVTDNKSPASKPHYFTAVDGGTIDIHYRSGTFY